MTICREYDPVFGQQYGPNDVTTAFAWDTDAISNTARVTTFLELLSRDPAVAPPLFDFEAGLWDGVVVREAADDRNVAAFAESEPLRSGFVDTNAIPGQSQFLGEIAPDLQSGDENRRLGFIVNGTVAQRDDLDVYSFMAESGTEVFLDIDMAGSRLDSVVELINANGVVLASSNDSILAETNPAAVYTDPSIQSDAAQPLTIASQPLPVQLLTIDQAIEDATDGELLLTLTGFEDPIAVPVEDFKLNPAAAIRAAMITAYPAELGTTESILLERESTDDFVIQLSFDDQVFTLDTLPQITVDGSSVVGAVVTGSATETVLLSQLQDDYSTNVRDAGFRVRLPGELGTRNLYHVRVRSSNTTDPLDFATLNDPSMVRDGLTYGGYELQIRLQEENERAGTQIRLSDVRFATTGLQIIGQPLHSPCSVKIMRRPRAMTRWQRRMLGLPVMVIWLQSDLLKVTSWQSFSAVLSRPLMLHGIGLMLHTRTSLVTMPRCICQLYLTSIMPVVLPGLTWHCTCSMGMANWC